MLLHPSAVEVVETNTCVVQARNALMSHLRQSEPIKTQSAQSTQNLCSFHKKTCRRLPATKCLAPCHLMPCLATVTVNVVSLSCHDDFPSCIIPAFINAWGPFEDNGRLQGRFTTITIEGEIDGMWIGTVGVNTSMVLCVVFATSIGDFPIVCVQHRSYAIVRVVVVVRNANRSATAARRQRGDFEPCVGHRDAKLAARCEQETRCYCLRQNSCECKRRFERTCKEELLQRYTG